MFALIIENALSGAEVIGPFEHEEDARAYGDEHYKLHIRRVTKLTAPAKK